MIITLEQVKELKALIASAQGAPIEVNSQGVTGTTFYQQVQRETELGAKSLHEASPEIILLIAKIAATSSNLQSCDFSFNFLGAEGPKVANALAKSATLNTVNMIWNSLGIHAPAVAAEFANSKSIHKVYMMTANYLNEELEAKIGLIFRTHNEIAEITRQGVPIINLLLENDYLLFLPDSLQEIVLGYIGNTPAQTIEWEF
jgi:hypothetical protein